MIPTILLVILGVVLAGAGYLNGDDTLLAFGLIVAAFAAVVGFLLLITRRRP